MTFRSQEKPDLESRPMHRVLILCTANSARSQLAEGLLRALHGDRFEVHSAGAHPTSVRREAIEVMAEIGIDISHHRSKSTAEFAGQSFDYILTVCDNARDACPYFPGSAIRIHQSFEDPASAGLAAFRRVRDQLRAWLAVFPPVQ
jgi:arsenate reductase